MSLKKLWPGFAILVVGFIACLTVNVYFYPSEAVDKAAQEIIEDIRNPEGETPIQDDSKGDGGNKESRLDLWNLMSPAHAADTETTVSNPAIDSIKARIKGRSAVLIPYLSSGAIGEGNDGLVAVREISALPMKDRATLNPIVKEENNDRMSLYREVAKELGVKDKDLPQVRKSFAKEWQRNAKPGWWIQDDSGQWRKR